MTKREQQIQRLKLLQQQNAQKSQPHVSPAHSIVEIETLQELVDGGVMVTYWFTNRKHEPEMTSGKVIGYKQIEHEGVLHTFIFVAAARFAEPQAVHWINQKVAYLSQFVGSK